MRLRDLAGLIVIDFIDMEENKNNRAVEKRLKECLKVDRARVQHGRISQFGLMEISRQRRRQGVLQATSDPCPACNGTGRRRSIPSAALQLIRAIEARRRRRLKGIGVKAPTDVALYILNNKREALIEIERLAGFAISIHSSEDMLPGDFEINAERDPNAKPKKRPTPRSLMKPTPPLPATRTMRTSTRMISSRPVMMPAMRTTTLRRPAPPLKASRKWTPPPTPPGRPQSRRTARNRAGSGRRRAL